MKKIAEGIKEKGISIILFIVYVTVGVLPLNLYAEGESGERIKINNSILLASKVIGKEGGIIEGDGVRFEVPKGALEKEVEIKISRLIRVEEGEVKNVTAGLGGYRFEPSGIQFKKECLIKMAYDERIEEEYAQEIYTYYYNKRKKAWEALKRKGVDVEKKVIESYTNHFTDMINGTLSLPESPGPVNINLNSIKELKAADAVGGIESIEGLKGLSEGSASFNMKLQVPSGVRGLSPELAVSYSSGSGYGVLGKGFGLSGIESISIDTRLGLPEYNGKDTYLINGIKVRYEGGGWKEERKQSYAAIKNEWVEGRGSGNYFEIKEKDGRVKIYGAKNWSGVSEGRKYLYYLDEIRDSFGNVIEYNYENGKSVEGEEVVLKEIVYGKERERRIKIEYEGREDVRVEGRGKYLKKESKRIREIKTEVKGEEVKTYKFNYKENTFLESLLESIEVRGSGKEEGVYAYRFEYEDAQSEGDGGIKVFGETEEWEKSGSISESVHISGGGSGSVGVGVNIENALSISGGMTGSGGVGRGYSKKNFVDVTGDGLADIVGWEKGKLKLYEAIREENGKLIYAERKDFDFSALEGSFLSENEDSSWSIGGRVDIIVAGIGANVGVTKQGSSGVNKAEFTDVNRDGFIDFVSNGKYYENNQGKGFKEGVGFKGAKNAKIKMSETEKKEMEKAHYFQEGIKAWRSPVSGIVHIMIDVKRKDKTKLCVYRSKRGDDSEKLCECLENKTYEIETDVKRGEYIYFVSETENKVEIGAGIEVEIRVEYKKYMRDELLGRNIQYLFPNKTYSTPEKEIINLYDKNEESIQYEDEEGNTHKGERTFWSLKSNYLSLIDENAIEKALALRYYGYIGREIKKEEFEKLYEKYGDKSDIENIIKYDGGFKEYIHTGDRSGDLNQHVMNRFISQADSQTLKKLTGYEKSEKLRYPLFYGNGDKYYRDILKVAENKERKEGNGGYESEEKILIGRIRGKEYKIKKEGKYKLYEQGIKNEEAEVILDKKTKDIKVLLKRKEEAGYESYIRLINKNIGCVISEKEYERGIEEVIHKDLEYKISRVERLSEDVYEIIKESTIFMNGGYVRVKELYEKDGNGYRIKDDVEEESILGIIEALIDVRKEGKIYISENKNVEGAKRVREISVFTEEEVKEIGRDYFEKIGGDSNQSYQIRKDISPEEKEKLKKSLKIYEGFKYDFAYFEYNKEKKEYKTKRENLVKEEVKNFLEYLESYYYEKVELIVEYPSSSLYPVKNGEIEVAKIKGGDLVIERERIKKYEGNENYKSGIYEGERGLEKISRYERLYGGENLWYYGLYSRYGEQTFSENELLKQNTHENKNKDDIEKEKEGVEKDVEKDRGSNGEEKDIKDEVNQKIGKEKLGGYISVQTYKALTEKNGKVPERESNTGFEFRDNSLIGSISTHVKNGFDREGEIKSEVKHYAAYIDDNLIYTSRITGSSYKDLPWVKEQGGGAVSFALSKTESESFDKNIGVSGGPLSGSIGFNSGTSEQTQGYMDINGDGYPDILKTENGYLLVQYGQDNLKFEKEKGLSGVSLSSNTNSSKVVGSAVGLSGSLKAVRDSKGKLKSVTVVSSGDTPYGISMSAGLNYSNGNQSQLGGLIDVNGDGLADYKNGAETKLNIGDEFKKAGMWNNTCISCGNVESRGGNIGGGLSALSTVFYGGVSFGVSANISRTTTEEILTDINGDGLPDKLSTAENGNYKIRINTGSGFSSKEKNISIGKLEIPEYARFFKEMISKVVEQTEKIQIPYKPQKIAGDFITEKIDEILAIPSSLEFNTSRSIGISGSLSGQVGIPIWTAPTVSLIFNFSGGGNGNYSESEVSLRLFDIDGDGLIDRVFNIGGDNKLYVQRNLLGKVGLLKKIKLPQGGSYELKYERVGNTVDLPQAKYVLSEVTARSGLKTKTGNEQEYTTHYTYDDGYYNRIEKEFYGFKTVRSKNAIGTETETEYYIDSYYRKGMVKREIIRNGSQIYSIKEYEVDTAPHARIKKEVNTVREGYSEIKIESEYEYDKYGNVTKLYDKGDVTNTNDDIIAEINYWKGGNGETYFKAHPEKIQVLHGKTGTLLRKREGAYDSRTGALVELKQYTAHGTYLLNRIEWTDEGNIKTIITPTGKRSEYKYLDGIYPIEIKEVSSKGDKAYISTIEWDSVLGVKLKETDAANNTMSYKYDNFGRVTEVRSPYDFERDKNNGKIIKAGETPYARYEYHTPADSFWYTVTENKISTEAEDSGVMKTIVIHDGLGRISYTAKEGEVYIDGTNDQTQTGWNISSAIHYDKAGRKTEEGMPFFYGGNLEQELVNKNSYEALEQFYELNNFTTIRNGTTYEYDDIDRNILTTLPDDYTQKNEYSIEAALHITKAIDPLENISISKKDARGNIKEVERLDKNNNLLTKARYEYSVLGEMLRAYDANENLLSVSYDLLGRRTALESKDTGKKEWIYDEKGRLQAETDSVLKAKASEIRYEYDGFDRIVKTDYPFSRDIEYKYGAPGEKGAGQVTYKKDETGETRYTYGNLNEVIKETRTINRYEAGSSPEKASFEYRSDYLGRMQSMKYPDGEVITYTYDAGGQLRGVSGEKTTNKGNIKYSYVDKILYDEHAQRVYIKYGNGVETRYKYDEKRRWLDTIETKNVQTQDIFQKIKYNFDAVGNVLGYNNDATTYETQQIYSYDNLYQLISVEGTSNQYKGKKSFGMTPVSIAKYKQTFSFDAIGNMKEKLSSTNIPGSQGNSYPKAELDYNLDYEYDPAYAHRLVKAGTRYYRYDANGNITAEKDGPFTDEEDFTFTYSYFENEDVYGTDYGFGLDAPKETEQTNPQDIFAYRRNYTWNERNLLTKSSDRNFTVHYRYGEDGQRALKYTDEGRSETLYFNNFFTIHIPTQDQNNPQGLRVHKHIFVGNSRLVTAMTHTDNHGDNEEQKAKQYYYHSDHLGSAQFVTDWKGRQYEHIEYTPYGELWIEEVAAGLDKLPFRFTGKELDEETGLYYYGARYLDPKYSRWLSGDPALGEYIPSPGTEPNKIAGMGGVYNTINLHVYHYAGNNPVKYTDPDGRVLWWQFADGVLQTFGGTAEAVAGACTVETGIGAFVFGWGLKDVGDGLLKISFALKDDEFSGMIPEAAGNVAESLGASDKTVEIVKDSTGLAEGAIGVGMGNIKTVSTGIKGLDTAGTAASAGSFTISVVSTLKNIFFSPDKPKETTFGNILGRYLNWQEHEKKYGNIYNPRYENMKETLKQDINRELSNSNISNKNRASYESMLRKLGD